MSGFRDLNKNGRLDPYEDQRRPVAERVDDLLGQMTLEEKAGLMFHPFMPIGEGGALVEGEAPLGPYADGYSTKAVISGQCLNHFALLRFPTPREMCDWVNALQKLAEETRLGIPVTLSSNPVHGYDHNPATGTSDNGFSRWPEPIGLGAIGDEDLVEQFADIARQEYLALGVRVALHPMADLATEPRWARISGTFGEDAELASRLVAAYIRGFQGASLGAHSVACMTKHFPGGGPQKDGEDAHFPYGREQVYPGEQFEYHLRPFEAAFGAGTSQVMPYYGVPVGIGLEEVGFSFSHDVVTGLLRERYGFDGIVCTDWRILTDFVVGGEVFTEAVCWGVEDLSPAQRLQKAVEAGCDQFGGESCPELLVELVNAGAIGEDRIDESARRLLREKFVLGLFDDPYVDPDVAEATVGKIEFRAAGEACQRRAITLLANTGVLPLADGAKIYVEGIDPAVAATFGTVVDSPADADFGVVRLSAPYQQRDGTFLERLFHAGDLDFKEPEKQRILDLLDRLPTIVDIYLDRPAVIPEIAERSAALLADFGAEDSAVLDVVFGRSVPEGRLPFELPSSLDAVRRQHEDVPSDSEDPVFAFGHGLS